MTCVSFAKTIGTENTHSRWKYHCKTCFKLKKKYAYKNHKLDGQWLWHCCQ